MIRRKRNSKSTELPEILKSESANHRNHEFYTTFMNLNSNAVAEMTSGYVERVYQTTKLSELRNKSLKLLYDKSFAHLEDFFLAAYKRERYLDMKILALRGLAQFASEETIESLLAKFNATLKKHPDKTPYNYQEYELLKGQNALPYLAKKYRYSCFAETLEIVNNQYVTMPNAFKGHFTVNSNGETVRLRTPEKTAKMIDEFFKRGRKA